VESKILVFINLNAPYTSISLQFLRQGNEYKNNF